MSNAVWENILGEWLERLKLGREWQRQAERMGGWNDLSGGAGLDLASEAAADMRPSERDIRLLLGGLRFEPPGNMRPKAGVSQRFNNLSRRRAVPAGRAEMDLPALLPAVSPADSPVYSPAGKPEKLSPAVEELNYGLGLVGHSLNISSGRTGNDAENGQESELTETAANQLAEELKNSEELKNTLELPLANAAVIEPEPAAVQFNAGIGREKLNDTDFMHLSDESLGGYANAPGLKRPEAGDSAYLEGGAAENFVWEREEQAEQAEAFAWPAAAVETPANPIEHGGEQVLAAANLDMLTEQVAARLCEDIEALLGSSSLV